MGDWRFRKRGQESGVRGLSFVGNLAPILCRVRVCAMWSGSIASAKRGRSEGMNYGNRGAPIFVFVGS